MTRSPTLPKPDPEAQSRSDLLLTKIISEIHREGPIPFSRYMEMALYEPSLGYYSASNIKFGKKGDFVTAPEISPLFSTCIANQCKQVLNTLQDAGILEFGAGSGKMACDILMTLEKEGHLPDFYWILDPSPDLQRRQKNLFKEKIPHLLDRIQWLSKLNKTFQGIVLANEVVDAMPVHRFKQIEALQEYYVDTDGKNLIWKLQECHNQGMIDYIKKFSLPYGYTSEINLAMGPWLFEISAYLKKGMVFIIDYGYAEQEYYHPQRNQGTLTCHYQHHTHDNPLILPGIQDITAHVDFTALERAAIQAGFHIAGFSNQMNFLIHCGLLESIDSNLNPIEQFKIHQQIKQLILPTEMGELFKVMALKKI